MLRHLPRPLAMCASLSVVAIAAAACPRPTETAAMTPAAAVALVSSRLDSLKTYRVSLESTLYTANVKRIAEALESARADGGTMEGPAPMRVTVRIEASLPDRMHLEGKGGPGGPSMDIDARYDGAQAFFTMKVTPPAGQTVLGKPPPADFGAQVVRADQKKLAAPGRPFDLAFNMRGFGLAEGDDFVGTVRWLLKRWPTTKAEQATCDGTPCLRLSGTLDVDAALDDIIVRDPQLGAQLAAQGQEQAGGHVDRLAELIADGLYSMDRLVLDVTAEGDVLGWSLGGPVGPLVETRVKSLERNVPIDDKVFVPAAPLPNATDVTEQVQKLRAQPAPSPEVVKAMKDKIKALAAR